MDMNLGKLWEMVRDREAWSAAAMGLQRFGRDLATEQQHKHSMHIPFQISVFVFLKYGCSIAQSCLILCDPTDCSTPGFPVLHYLPEFAQIHVH